MTPAQIKGRRGILRAKITRLRQERATLAVRIAEAQAELVSLVVPIEASKKAVKKKDSKK